MSRRFAIALLALLVAVTGVSVCARTAQACAAMSATARDCCGTAKAFSASDCCCPAKAGPTASLPPSGIGQAAAAQAALAAGPAVLPAGFSFTAPRSWSVVRARTLAPPDTPVSRCISLLL